MALDMKKIFEFSVDNITKYGDTDIFPFPIEKHIMFDEKNSTLQILEKIHTDYDKFVTETPPCFINMLTPSGYTGFRWATQVDPIWNAYLLGLVLSISQEIEDSRIPKERNNIFSYRIKLDDTEKTIFDVNYGWRSFQEQSLNLAKDDRYKYVLTCDISNFYSNVYHHRIENSLAKLGVQDKRIEKNIMDILQRFSNTKSYGLPIGGQASRILAELLLNRTDKLLRSEEISFCRFVDDYHIFAASEKEAYSHLLFISKILIENEGLSLQKSKTRIVTTDEFSQTSILNDSENNSAKNIFAISLKYDPYSMTADEDYEKLKQEISNLGILSVLTQELSKSRVHTSLLKKLIGTLKYLEKSSLESAAEALLSNLNILAPVFPNIMILFDSVFDDLSEGVQDKILETLRDMINEASYVMKIELNIAYALRVLAKRYNEDNEISVLKIYKNTQSELIKRDIIIIMAKWNASHWISDIKNRYSTLTNLEKRSFIMASYRLGDEGKHWRTHHKSSFSSLDILYRDWVSNKPLANGWEYPI